MIVGEHKPIEEIIESVKEFSNVLVVGCQTCVAVSLTGGDKAARSMAQALTHAFKDYKTLHIFENSVLERQCEKDWIEPFFDLPQGVDAILSLACGAGVQTMADIFKGIPVLPGLNTTFLGAQDQTGVFNEKCAGCGDCLLGLTGGICPITRCAKKLLNGPCGGSTNGKCEISISTGRDVDCAWHLIVERLKELGKLDNYEKISEMKNWTPGGFGGPRQLIYPGETPF
ncbi:methylenetetrahydrofolate reductase C-terminal domain-containing protein [Desulfobacula sp.]